MKIKTVPKNMNCKMINRERHSTRSFKITESKSEWDVDQEENYCRSLYIFGATDIVQILSAVTLVLCS